MRFAFLLLILTASLLAADYDQLQCEWRGFSPVCRGYCEPGEHKVKEAATATEAVPYQDTFGKECWYGKKFYCCKRNETDVNRVDNQFIAYTLN